MASKPPDYDQQQSIASQSQHRVSCNLKLTQLNLQDQANLTSRSRLLFEFWDNSKQTGFFVSSLGPESKIGLLQPIWPNWHLELFSHHKRPAVVVVGADVLAFLVVITDVPVMTVET